MYVDFEMEYFVDSKEGKLICLLCQHYCELGPNQIGICGVNQNINGAIKCLVYGKVAALNIDPVEKKPLYHFLPNTTTLSFGTVGCNFRCPFCQNWGISQEKEIEKKSKNYTPAQLVQIALQNGCKSISYTYNEPTIFYPFIRDVAILAKANGLKNVFVTNGFESTEVLNDMAKFIDAANVDLKSFNPSYYKKKLKGNLHILKENLKLFKKLGIWIEVTTLIIPTKNDTDEELNQIATFIATELSADTPWHLSAFHPDYKELDLPRTSVQTLQRAYNIGKKAGLKFVYMGNAGLANPTHCTKCGEELLNRTTYKITKNIIKNGHLCPKCNHALEGVFMSKKDLAVCGTFYPKSCDEIKKYFHHFNTILTNSNFDPSSITFTPRAIIAPHAGYIYSGFTANVAYSLAKNLIPKRVIIIGPSHKVYLEGASVSDFAIYPTPCGELAMDQEYIQKLLAKFDFLHFIPDAHREHSTETQAPFVQHYFSKSKVIEVVYGKIDFLELEKLVTTILEDNDNFLVISTDLSHFYTLSDAKKLDNICLEAIAKLDLDIWNQGCEACGRTGVKALLSYAKKTNMPHKLLDYRTSADVTKDENRVVGYVSAIFGEM